MSSLSLVDHCQVCDKTEGLSRCAGCKVVMYCDREHQTKNWPHHKGICGEIKKARKKADDEEKALRAQPGDMFCPPGATIFEEQAGLFWGITETRNYMRARYAIVQAILKVKNQRAAVQEAYDIIRDLIRLCRGDNMGVRFQLPSLALRLGYDQECYDFIKWYATEGQSSSYDWGDMDLGFLDVKDADVFEPVDMYKSEWFALSHSIAVALIKIRLLLDLKSLQSAQQIGVKVPQEILDEIRGKLVSSVVAKNKEIMNSQDQTALIDKLEGQIKELYKAIKKSNKHFLPALVNPGRYLTAPITMYSHGSPEEMILALQYSHQSWVETPGSIDIIRDLITKDKA